MIKIQNLPHFIAECGRFFIELSDLFHPKHLPRDESDFSSLMLNFVEFYSIIITKYQGRW